MTDNDMTFDEAAEALERAKEPMTRDFLIELLEEAVESNKALISLVQSLAARLASIEAKIGGGYHKYTDPYPMYPQQPWITYNSTNTVPLNKGDFTAQTTEVYNMVENLLNEVEDS